MAYLDKLPAGTSLELYADGTGKPVFRSGSHWLYPLFEAEDFLSASAFDRAQLSLHDTVSGIAAAALTVCLGIRRVNADLMSRGAMELYEKYGVTYHYGRLIERIECATESLLDISMSLDECHEILRRRAGR